MGPIDAFWHVLNFFGPAIGVGLIAPSMAKLLWRRRLRQASWRVLVAWVTAACAAVLVAGLVVFGHDGKMATYAAVVAASALVLWWRGFASRPA